METLLLDIRFGGGVLLKNKGFTLVATAARALGIGASTAMASIVDRVLLRPLPYANPERAISFDAVTGYWPARRAAKLNPVVALSEQ